MNRRLTFALSLFTLTFLFAATANAQNASLNVNADYQSGIFTDTASADVVSGIATGLLVSAELMPEQVGVIVEYSTSHITNFKEHDSNGIVIDLNEAEHAVITGNQTTTKLFGVYKLALSPSFELDPLLGYEFGSFNVTYEYPGVTGIGTLRNSGFAFGMKANINIGKVIVNGYFDYCPTIAVTTTNPSSIATNGTGSKNCINLKASYPVNDRLNFETGYKSDTIAFKLDSQLSEEELSLATFFAGVKVSF